jgi:uncharacterized membrane protein
MDDPTATPQSRRARASRSVPGYAVLVGLVAVAILLQGIFAGIFIEPGTHSGALSAHNVNADVALGLAIVAAGYAIAFLRNDDPPLVIGSVVLVAVLIALVAIGHAITGSNDDGLTPVHVPLALFAFGQTIWLIVRARSLRKASS